MSASQRPKSGKAASAGEPPIRWPLWLDWATAGWGGGRSHAALGGWRKRAPGTWAHVINLGTSWVGALADEVEVNRFIAWLWSMVPFLFNTILDLIFNRTLTAFCLWFFVCGLRFYIFTPL